MYGSECSQQLWPGCTDTSTPSLVNITLHQVQNATTILGNNYEASYIVSFNETMAPYERVVNMKSLMKPNASVLISLGGWSWRNGSLDILVDPIFQRMVRDQEWRTHFINDAIAMARAFNFSGVEIDWEVSEDGNYSGYGDFLKQFRDAITTEANKTNFTQLYLAITAPGRYPQINQMLDELPSLYTYVDHIHLMAYDLHGPWENVTGHQSSMQLRFDESATEMQRNSTVYGVVTSYLRKVPDVNSKLVLGVPSYGRTFMLDQNATCTTGSPVIGAGIPQPCTNQYGLASYFEIENLNSEGFVVTWDELSQAPWTCSSSMGMWISYEDHRSLKAKTEVVKMKELKGIALYSLDMDSFLRRYPLLQSIECSFNPNNTICVAPMSLATGLVM